VQEAPTDTNPGIDSAQNATIWGSLGWVFWIVPMLVVTGLVVNRPYDRTVTPLYHEATSRFFAQLPLYKGPTGMNYLPPFPLLFAPFHVMPEPWGDVAWRWMSAAMLALGLRKWAFMWPGSVADPRKLFTTLTALTLPLALPAIRNGQANAALAGLFLLAAAAYTEQRWTIGSLLLAVAVAVKPLGLAAIGLAAAAFPSAIPSLASTLALVLFLPNLAAHCPFVTSQYLACLDNLRHCASISENRFADLNGILRAVGFEMSGFTALAVRAGAGAVLFLVALLGARNEPEPRRTLIWYGFAAAYLMLFNPMTEANSYAIIAPVLALWAAEAWYEEEARIFSLGIAALALTMGLLPNILRPWLGNQFALVWHPSMTLIFLVGVVALLIFRPRIDEL
jgi:alpha-1,2-mannosyltransferase